MTGQLSVSTDAGRSRRYTVREAAEILREHPQTTYHRLRTGQLRGVQYTRGGTWFIRAEDLDSFLDPAARSTRTRRSA